MMLREFWCRIFHKKHRIEEGSFDSWLNITSVWCDTCMRRWWRL